MIKAYREFQDVDLSAVGTQVFQVQAIKM